jgi:hypothetical protein
LPAFRPVVLLCLLLIAAFVLPQAANAQGGPPFLTNDPGTPGDGNWEINIASMQTIARGAAYYQTPQVDVNFGIGDRIQLTYEVPYQVVTHDDARASGWGNAYPGIKWRFVDQGPAGWRVSVFPQVETGVSPHAQQVGLGEPGPRYLLPIEVSKNFGPVAVDFEAGSYVAGRGPHEFIAGLAVGHNFTNRLEFDAEFYDDRGADGALPQAATFDLGGRYQITPAFIALFMAGRSIDGTGSGQPAFMAYLGVQILLKDYGRKLMSGP